MLSATHAQDTLPTREQAVAVSSFFDRYESVYLECKELQKTPLNDSLNLREWSSKFRFACDPNRRTGISIPKNIPSETYDSILRGIECADILSQETLQLVQAKLVIDADRTMSEQDRKAALKLRGESATSKISTCMPHVQRVEEIRRQAARAARK